MSIKIKDIVRKKEWKEGDNYYLGYIVDSITNRDPKFFPKIKRIIGNVTIPTKTAQELSDTYDTHWADDTISEPKLEKALKNEQSK